MSLIDSWRARATPVPPILFEELAAASPAMVLVNHSGPTPIAHRIPESRFTDAPPPCWPDGSAVTCFPTPASSHHGEYCQDPKCFGGAR